MFDRMIVQKALKRAWESNEMPGLSGKRIKEDQSGLTSTLIHDIFGGEILKTHIKNGWHFYNRIEGESIDFTDSGIEKSHHLNKFDDIPSTPDETYNHFEQEKYTTFFTRFISAFEEVVGLEKYQTGYTV